MPPPLPSRLAQHSHGILRNVPKPLMPALGPLPSTLQLAIPPSFSTLLRNLQVSSPRAVNGSPEGALGRRSGRCVEARLGEMLWKCQTSFHFLVEQNPGCWSVQPCDQKTFVQSSEVMCGWAGIFGGPERPPLTFLLPVSSLLSSPLITGSELISFGCYEEQTLWLSAEGQSLVFLSGY